MEKATSHTHTHTHTRARARSTGPAPHAPQRRWKPGLRWQATHHCDQSQTRPSTAARNKNPGVKVRTSNHIGERARVQESISCQSKSLSLCMPGWDGQCPRVRAPSHHGDSMSPQLLRAAQLPILKQQQGFYIAKSTTRESMKSTE